MKPAEIEKSDSDLPKCSCGFDRNHFMTTTKGKYSFWGWLGLLYGISMKPRKVLFKCTRCGEAFDETDDASYLKKSYIDSG